MTDGSRLVPTRAKAVRHPGGNRFTRGFLDDARLLAAGGKVVASVPAGASRTLTAMELESGAGLAGALGNGKGKWRLEIVADQPILVTSLLENRATGHLTNLSSRPPHGAYIADDNLRAAVEDTLGVPHGGAITTDQMRMLGCLWAEQRVADLTGMEAATVLTLLGLGTYYNDLVDISPLAGLTALAVLYLEDNDIVDISPLAGMIALNHLSLPTNNIADIAPLAGLTALQTLRLRGNRIADISFLSKLTDLVELDLEGNDVFDISALVDLTALKTLDLSYNSIVDLAPLVDLANTAALEIVEVDYNPLGDAARQTQIAALRQHRVDVRVHEPFPDDDDFPGSRMIRTHNDNVAVMHAPTDLAFGGDAAANAQDFLKWFSDSFDFIVLYSNLDDADAAAAITGYYGAYSHVNNGTLGLGPFGVFYDSRYGSAGKLKGVIHIPYNDHGPLAHELLHAWSQFAVPSAAGGHWGFSSAAGVHGGFERAELIDLGEGRYSAGDFGGWGGSGRYSSIELYLAGYIAPQEVPSLWVAADGAWLEEDGMPVYDQSSNPVFTAGDVREYAIEDIVAEHGPRVPSHAEAQWHFRAAAILLTDADHPATDEQLERISAAVAHFSYNGDDGDADSDNFYEATSGRSSLTMDGLAQLRKASPGIGELPSSFGAVPPPAFCRPRPDGEGWMHDRARTVTGR